VRQTSARLGEGIDRDFSGVMAERRLGRLPFSEWATMPSELGELCVVAAQQNHYRRNYCRRPDESAQVEQQVDSDESAEFEDLRRLILWKAMQRSDSHVKKVIVMSASDRSP
jgi:hypothetical protein